MTSPTDIAATALADWVLLREHLRRVAEVNPSLARSIVAKILREALELDRLTAENNTAGPA